MFKGKRNQKELNSLKKKRMDLPLAFLVAITWTN